jgi:hypothetical protein
MRPTEPLTKMSTRPRKMFLRRGARSTRKAENLTAICESIVSTMWDPQHLATLQASTVCHGDSFIFFLFFISIPLLRSRSQYNSKAILALNVLAYCPVFDPISFT